MVTRKEKNTRNRCEIAKELRKVDRLFADLEKDKKLPTFVDFFMTCLMHGTAEQVNLKKMYPDTYATLTGILELHRADIQAM